MKKTGPISNVVIAIAMKDEASPFVRKLDLQPEPTIFPPNTPFLAYTGSYRQCQVTVITNGRDSVYGTGVDNVGTVPAALATYLALQKIENADIVINAGTCGGFRRKGAEIGDVFLTTAVTNHDRRIPIPEFAPYGIGRIENMDVSKLALHLGVKTGVCTTSNSLDFHAVDARHMQENDASVKDMEAAAIAWSCELHHTPYFGVKVVTDIVDGEIPSQEEFLENLHTAAHSLQESLPIVMEYICGRTHEEL